MGKSVAGQGLQEEEPDVGTLEQGQHLGFQSICHNECINTADMEMFSQSLVSPQIMLKRLCQSFHFFVWMTPG